MVCRCVLFRIQVHQPQIKRHYPLKGVQVKCSFEASNRSDVLLFAEETHTYVVPQLAGVWRVHGSDSVLEQSGIVVSLVLDDGASC